MISGLERGGYMKVFYLSSDELFYSVVYANSKEEAFEKMKCSRKELFRILGSPSDIERWDIEEFTPDSYDGVLCFY